MLMIHFILFAASVCNAYTTLSTTLAKYPAFAGSEKIRGWVTVDVNPETNLLRVTYGLSGLETSTTGGVHVHAGKTCTDHDLVQGHFWDSDGGNNPDPWNTEWESDGNGMGWGTFDIDSGFNTIADNDGRAIVVHLSSASGSTRAACGVLTGFNTLAVTQFSAYPAYSGNAGWSGGAPSGLFLVSEATDALSIGYKLSGLETSTSGGIHIHSGTSCATHDDVGGHYYNTSDDGWTTNWASDSSGNGLGWFTLDSGWNALSQNQGHTVVVHNAAGARIGCGILDPLPNLHASMGKYPAYPGSLSITGDVEATVNVNGEITLQFALKGLETSTSGGIHIHAGTSCATHDQVGGHYWNETGMADPWSTDWTSDEYGNAVGTISVDSGLNMLTDNLGHAVVVHESGSPRAACGTLGTVATWLESSDLAPYPGYAGSLEFSGKVYATALTDGTLQMEWELENMEPSMMGGIHVHSGVTCAEHADVSGHYWDSTNAADFSVDSVDPWNVVMWGASMSGKSNGIAILDTGFNSLADNNGHAVVVHDSSGTRTACAVLSVYRENENLDNGGSGGGGDISVPLEGAGTSAGQYVMIFILLSPIIPLFWVATRKKSEQIKQKTMHMKQLQSAADRLAKIEGGNIDLDADTQRGYIDDEVSVRIQETHDGPAGQETLEKDTPTPPISPVRSASDRQDYPGGELSPRSMRAGGDGPLAGLAAPEITFPTGPAGDESGNDVPGQVEAPSSPAPVAPNEQAPEAPDEPAPAPVKPRSISQNPPVGLPPTVSEVQGTKGLQLPQVEVGRTDAPPALPPRKGADNGKSNESRASGIGRQDTWTL